MRHTLRIPLLIVAAASAMLVACDDRTGFGFGAARSEERVMPSNMAAEHPTGPVASTGSIDAAITASVKAQLARDAQLAALPIEVETSAGRVALKGTVPYPALRERAFQLAQSVPGVVAVDNRITLISG